MAPSGNAGANENWGAIAQLGERYNGIVEVSGSIPLSSTNLVQKTTRLSAGFFVRWSSFVVPGLPGQPD